MKAGDKVRVKPLSELQDMNWAESSTGNTPEMVRMAEQGAEFVLGEKHAYDNCYYGSNGFWWDPDWLIPLGVSRVKPVKKETNVR